MVFDRWQRLPGPRLHVRVVIRTGFGSKLADVLVMIGTIAFIYAWSNLAPERLDKACVESLIFRIEAGEPWNVIDPPPVKFARMMPVCSGPTHQLRTARPFPDRSTRWPTGPSLAWGAAEEL